MKNRKKKPVLAWLTNSSSFDELDGVAVVAARTERGARGRVRAAAWEAGFDMHGIKIAVDRLGPLDAWISTQRPDVAWNISIALFQAMDALRDKNEKRDAVVEAAVFHHVSLLAIAIDIKDERLHLAARVASERLGDKVVAYRAAVERPKEAA